MREENFITVNGLQFKFKDLTAVNNLKLQQRLINKVKLDESSVKLLVNFTMDGLASMEENALSNFLLILFKTIQSFKPDELIDFITTLIEMFNIETLVGDKYTLVSINRDFSKDFNSVFLLIFELMKSMYSGFFLMDLPQENKVKVTRKEAC